MKPKLFIIYMLLVLVPLATITWLGLALARNERMMTTIRFQELLTAKLNDVRTDIAKLLEQRERVLLEQPELASLPPATLRERASTSELVRHYFILDPQGNLVYPSPTGPLTTTERHFLDRTLSIWLNGDIPGPEAETTNTPNTNTAKSSLSPSFPTTTAKGWHAWYRGNGIGLLFWWRDSTGNVVGAEINEMRITADIIAALPDAAPDTSPAKSSLPQSHIVLADAKECILYQWGDYVPPKGESPRAQLALLPPLSTWHLAYYAPSTTAGVIFPGSILFNILSGVVVLGIALAGLSIYFYREHTRTLREAQQRVSFVNQVSHELKTPLTNIRLYAELLSEKLTDMDEATSRHLRVIITESQRLSRLINNVLNFGREQRGLLKLHKTPGHVDEALREILDRFHAALQVRDIQWTFEGNAEDEVEFDHDILEQIMGNLLSNAEKYLPAGSRLTVNSRQFEDRVKITVTDNGPGIPPHLHERIFDPFYRISNRLTDGVAGAGIGLTIARQLAQLHGGNLTIEPITHGVCFCVELGVAKTFTSPENPHENPRGGR